MTEKFFNAAYNIWNSLVDIAMTMFTASPTEVNGGTLYEVAHNAYKALQAISIPIAMLFFLIAILKSGFETQSGQQLKRMFVDALKFGIMIFVLCYLWEFMGYIIQVADGITNAVAVDGDYHLSMSSEMQNTIQEVINKDVPYECVWNPLDSDFNLIEYLGDKAKILGMQGMFLLTAFITCIINIGAGLTMLSCSFQRIIKPLVILPFSTITVAMGAGTNEAAQITRSYIKTFFGMCISGAVMVICIKLGASIINGAGTGGTILTFNTSSMDTMDKMIYNSAVNLISPLVIVGLVKGVDGIISRFF